MSPIKFFYVPGSPPCRGVLLTAAALNIDMDMKILNLMKGEHMTPEFIKINPVHTVPTIDDNGFILFESRAIMQYMVNKYGKTDCLYPKEAQKRAMVDQMLYFDMGTLYASFMNYYNPKIFAGAPHDENNYKKIQSALENMDKLIDGRKYAAGDRLTIADLALVATVSTLDMLDYDFSGYKNVKEWYKWVQETAPKYEEANHKNALMFKQLVHEMTAARK